MEKLMPDNDLRPQDGENFLPDSGGIFPLREGEDIFYKTVVIRRI
jgi:hypothetical protein